MLDEVYPELQLMARVADMKAALRARHWHVGPGVLEPAHQVDLLQRLDPRVMGELDAVLKKHGM